MCVCVCVCVLGWANIENDQMNRVTEGQNLQCFLLNSKFRAVLD